MRNKWLKRALVACILCALITPLAVCFGRNVRKQVAESGNALVQETVQKRLNVTCREVLGANAGEPVRLTTREDKTQLVAVNTDYMNALAARCNVACAEDLNQYERMTLYLPRGALTGSTYLADKGTVTAWQMHVSYEISTDYFSRCQSVGINQIRYAVYLQVHTTARVTIPSIIQNVQYTYAIAVCEMVYNADVPNVYVADENGMNFLDLLP